MFNVKGDIKPIIKHLNKTQKKQIPFAAAQAINNTLFDIMKAEKAQMPKKIAKSVNINTNNLLIIRNISRYASVAVTNFSRAENQEVCLSISHQHYKLF